MRCGRCDESLDAWLLPFGEHCISGALLASSTFTDALRKYQILASISVGWSDGPRPEEEDSPVHQLSPSRGTQLSNYFLLVHRFYFFSVLSEDAPDVRIRRDSNSIFQSFSEDSFHSLALTGKIYTLTSLCFGFVLAPLLL